MKEDISVLREKLIKLGINPFRAGQLAFHSGHIEPTQYWVLRDSLTAQDCPPENIEAIIELLQQRYNEVQKDLDDLSNNLNKKNRMDNDLITPYAGFTKEERMRAWCIREALAWYDRLTDQKDVEAKPPFKDIASFAKDIEYYIETGKRYSQDNEKV